MQQQTRFAAIDSARSSMMPLGILVHTLLLAEFFYPNLTASELGTSQSIYQSIHLFRMPVFFILAGYFAAYLVRENGNRAFVVSRFKRVVSQLIAAELFVGALVYFQGCSWCVNPIGPGDHSGQLSAVG